jgi:hypothetical protein
MNHQNERVDRAAKFLRLVSSRQCGMCDQPLGRRVVLVGRDSAVRKLLFAEPAMCHKCGMKVLQEVGKPGWAAVICTDYRVIFNEKMMRPLLQAINVVGAVDYQPSSEPTNQQP